MNNAAKQNCLFFELRGEFAARAHFIIPPDEFGMRPFYRRRLKSATIFTPGQCHQLNYVELSQFSFAFRTINDLLGQLSFHFRFKQRRTVYLGYFKLSSELIARG